ncbi:MAG TPA: DUF3300 domain-containing protein [Methylophilaceae bacterium]|nr:DUF3300 domain-containing protein [Methylophilaceae bacterium]
MKMFIRTLALLLLTCMPVAFAEEADQPNESVFSQQELDQMLAPVALYPDSLLSQVLMASTYPLEVVQAARWSRANPELKGNQAVKAAEQKNWDPSVASLTAFPQILAMMDEKLDWTERLGIAFTNQQTQVMDTVQNLRQQAMAAGNLKTNDQIRVIEQGQIIVIEQAAPQIVHVPYYNPTVAYGTWRWDTHPPVYWAPWPGYYRSPGLDPFYWSSGVVVGSSFFFSNFDWPRHHIHSVHPHHFHHKHKHDGRHKFHRRGLDGHQKKSDSRQHDAHRPGFSDPTVGTRGVNANMNPAKPSMPAGAPMVRPENRNAGMPAPPTERVNPTISPRIPQTLDMNRPGQVENTLNSISRGSAINPPPPNSPTQQLGIGQERSIGTRGVNANMNPAKPSMPAGGQERSIGNRHNGHPGQR